MTTAAIRFEAGIWDGDLDALFASEAQRITRRDREHDRHLLRAGTIRDLPPGQREAASLLSCGTNVFNPNARDQAMNRP